MEVLLKEIEKVITPNQYGALIQDIPTLLTS